MIPLHIDFLFTTCNHQKREQKTVLTRDAAATAEWSSTRWLMHEAYVCAKRSWERDDRWTRAYDKTEDARLAEDIKTRVVTIPKMQDWLKISKIDERRYQ
jgi:hypothetical protein